MEGFYNEFPDNGGIQLQFSKNMTLKGLTIKSMGVETGKWNQSAITDLCRYDSDKCGDPDYSLTLDGCTFIGSTDINEHAILLGNTTVLTVKNCTFSDFYSAISFMEDGYIANAVIVDSNTFISCDRAIDGYFGGGSSALSESDLGELKFTNNIVTGTTSMYSKVLLADQYATTETENHDAWGYVTISGNELENAALILFEMETNLDLDSLIDNNTFGDNTYIAVGSEAQNVITLTYSAESDEDQIGYWELLDTSEMSIVETSWTDDEIALIKKAVEDANSTGAHTLTLDFSELYTSDYWSSYVYTIMTRLKYGVRWVGTPGDDIPDVAKSVNVDSILAGGTATYTISTSVPEYLGIYLEEIDYTAYATERGEYEITIHDVMDSRLELDVDSITLTLGEDYAIDSDYYTVVTDTEDSCTFELVVDLVALYKAGIISDDDITNETAIYVEYDVTATEAGTFENITSLTAYNLSIKSDTVTITVTDAPKTGDDSNTGLMAVLLIMALIGCFGVTLYKRRG